MKNMSMATFQDKIVFRASHTLHPLDFVVVHVARQVGVLDISKLACELSGCAVFSGKRAASAIRAYSIVAEDVLGYMHSQGRLNLREDGWYELIAELKLEGSKGSKDKIG